MMTYQVDLANLKYMSDVNGKPDLERALALLKAESGVKDKEIPRRAEVESLLALLRMLNAEGIPQADLRGFYCFCRIPHISKEFDLVKICDDFMLDIELKSGVVSAGQIEHQLTENRYYLKGLNRKSIKLFTFVESSSALYCLTGDGFAECRLITLVECMSGLRAIKDVEFGGLFAPNEYLVSPINDRERFIKGDYFLTDQQRNFKKQFIEYVHGMGPSGFVLQGGAGTGKTLLLYDIARDMSLNSASPAYIVHCAPLEDVHREFNRNNRKLKIVHVKNAESCSFRGCPFVGIDEAHRIYKDDLESLVEKLTENDVPFMASLDPCQALSKSEVNRDVLSELKRTIPAERCLKLKKKIRSNEDICKFIDGLYDKALSVESSRESIKLVYTYSVSQAMEAVAEFVAQGYKYIELSLSRYSSGRIDDYSLHGGCPSTHRVIGQEFDKVVMVVPPFFYYEGRRLKAEEHPYPEYLTDRLLYEGMTRARTSLALVFDRNSAVFERALELM